MLITWGCNVYAIIYFFSVSYNHGKFFFIGQKSQLKVTQTMIKCATDK
jgi:hypothetical protein